LNSGRYLSTILSCLLLFSFSSTASAQPGHVPKDILEGIVVGVSEGDRITVNSFGTEIFVRLYGIAAPQTAKVDKFTGWHKAGQPFAEDAFRALSIKVLHQQVQLEIRRTLVFKNGARQMALAVVHLGGRNINLEMVADGYAWAYRALADGPNIHGYLAAEKYARSRNNGLWRQENPQPPWEFKLRMKVKYKHD